MKYMTENWIKFIIISAGPGGGGRTCGVQGKQRRERGIIRKEQGKNGVIVFAKGLATGLLMGVKPNKFFW